MDLVIFAEGKPLVLQALKNGDFDYIEGASEVFETEFFSYIKAKGILDELTTTYPTPRKREQVPLILYMGGNLSMRLHGEHAFHAFPTVVRLGGMINVLGARAGRKVTHPDTGDVTLSCEGYNKKNHYDRETPCDPDFLRKLAKHTKPEELTDWFNQDVASIFRKKRGFDSEGVFIGDSSYLFVPDNENYEGSKRLRFDEGNHPVDLDAYEKMSPEQKARCRWRRCYKMMTLLHTNRDLDFFLFVGVRVLSGEKHEAPVLYEMVDQFVQTMGKGVMKLLILDRGFLDGGAIARCKSEHQVDVLIPIRRNMDIYTDAMSLLDDPDVVWEPWVKPETAPRQEMSPAPAPAGEDPGEVCKPRRPRPRSIIKREESRRKKLEELAQNTPPPPPEKTLVKTEVALIKGFTSWSSCTVPLQVTASRELYASGEETIWLLADTRENVPAVQGRRDYLLRTAIEERYRQLKCFCDLTNFTSPAFSLVLNQVIFIMLAFNLLQHFLRKQHRKDLTNKPQPLIRRQLLPSTNHIIVYWQDHYGFFDPIEFTEIIATLEDEARRRVAEKCRQLRRELSTELANPRPP